MVRSVRGQLRRGTLFDPRIRPLLDKEARRTADSLAEEATLRVPPGRTPSVFVSLAPHTLHYLDLRIALLTANLVEAGAHATILFRDHQSPSSQAGATFAEGKARFLEILQLLRVPTARVSVLEWTEVAHRLAVHPDHHRFLAAVETAQAAAAAERGRPLAVDLLEALTTLTDVFLASHPRFHPSAWLLGGPSRVALQTLGQEAFGRTVDAPPAHVLPLPRLPILPSLPRLLPEGAARPASVLSDCMRLPTAELVMVHYAFLDLVEESFGEALAARRNARQPEALGREDLVAVTAAGIEESLDRMRARVRRRGPEPRLEVPPDRAVDVLEALGEGRRTRILQILMATDAGIEAADVVRALGLPASMLTTVRRDLARLRAAGLVVGVGVKPVRYRATAREVEIRLAHRGSDA